MTRQSIYPARLRRHKDPWRAVLTAARAAFRNQDLTRDDLMEWKATEIDPMPGEVVAYVDDPGVWIAVKAVHDRRPRP